MCEMSGGGEMDKLKDRHKHTQKPEREDALALF